MSLLHAALDLAAAAEPPFKAQVTDSLFLLDVFYALATVCLLFIVPAVGLIDAGLVRRKNVLDTWMQKILGALVAAGGMFVVGYAIWQIQFYQAFAIPHPVTQALKDWWAFGSNATTFSQNLDPAVSPEADVFQIFLAFFMAYAAVGGALLHSAGLERVKALPMYIICAIAGAIVIPIGLYYTWGSVSPLTNRGVHDYIGNYSLYIIVGVWALIIAWRAGPRLGAFTKDARTIGPVPSNFGMSALGIGILMFAAPFAFLGCGYWAAGSGYFGISLTTSGFGIAMLNIFVSYIGGGVAGGIISYRTKNPLMALIGVAAGYISCGTCLDIAKPWQAFIVAFIGTFVVWGVYNLLYKLRIDDKKIVPLALGGGIYGALAGGVVGSGKATGGYFGLTGKWAPQHATISLGWQAIGVLVIVGIALVSGLIVIVGLEKTIGLRVTEEQEIAGLDDTYWQTPPSPYEDAPAVNGSAAAPNGLHETREVAKSS
jgi:ammonium transporter, Amt family